MSQNRIEARFSCFLQTTRSRISRNSIAVALLFGGGGKRKALPEREVKTDLARLLAIPFEPELWEKADWRGMVFQLPDDRPPALGLGFVNEDAARQIFRQWLEWVGPRDEREELRVSIIEGDIPGQGPGYSVHVGLDAQAFFERYKKMGVATDKDLFVTPSEINRGNNLSHLAAFVRGK